MIRRGTTIVLLIAFMTGCEKDDCIDESKISNGPCPMINLPVCGCDGKTYGNGCMAQNAGVTSFETGECKGK